MDRKAEEVEFHDRREQDRLLLSEEEFNRKYSNKKWYIITEAQERYIDDWLARHTRGKAVLDYCCGLGGSSVRVAKAGAAKVFGIDISPGSVATAQQRMAEAGFADKSVHQVMDAEKTTFPDDSFDVVYCSGVLHHLDVRLAFPELARLCRPDGRVLAIEALGYNPLIAAYRRLTPGLRTAWEADHILTHADLKVARGFFRRCQVRYFHLFTLLSVPFRNTPVFRPLLAVLTAVDAVVLRIPFVQLMAWQMVFELSEPMKGKAR